MEHIATLRLFDSSRADLQGRFKLADWELDHLKECEDCRHVQEVFMRQFTGTRAKDGDKKSAA